MRYIVQWEREDSKAGFIVGDWRGYLSVANTEIGPIATRFHCQELMKSDCLRFVDPEIDTIFNCRQVDVIEKEIKTLLSLDLTDEEREDCVNLQEFAAYFSGSSRNLLYLRIYPKPIYPNE